MFGHVYTKISETANQLIDWKRVQEIADVVGHRYTRQELLMKAGFITLLAASDFFDFLLKAEKKESYSNLYTAIVLLHYEIAPFVLTLYPETKKRMEKEVAFERMVMERELAYQTKIKELEALIGKTYTKAERASERIIDDLHGAFDVMPISGNNGLRFNLDKVIESIQEISLGDEVLGLKSETWKLQEQLLTKLYDIANSDNPDYAFWKQDPDEMLAKLREDNVNIRTYQAS